MIIFDNVIKRGVQNRINDIFFETIYANIFQNCTLNGSDTN